MQKCNFVKVALGTMMCTALLAGTCFAAESEGEIKGLSVSVNTDKDDYEVGEHIIVTVTAENTTDGAVKDVVIKNAVPDGYQVAAGTEKDFAIDSIEAGTKVIRTTEYEVVVSAPAADEGNHDSGKKGHSSHKSDSSSTPTTTVEETVVPLADTVETVVIPEEAVAQAATPQPAANNGAPKTGDDSNLVWWMMLLAVSATACGVLYYKKKEIRRYLAFALVVAVAGGSFSVCQMSAKAAENDNSIVLAREVNVAGNTVTLKTQIFCGAMVKGYAYDATNPDEKIADATIKFRSGADNKTGAYVTDASGDIQLTTDSEGNYVCQLPKGEYTLECSKDGFITSYVNVTSDVSANEYNVPMSTELGTDEYRIVLTWGTSPSDIDAHLEFDDNHVYYHRKEVVKNGTSATLDVDDRDGEGPETITLTAKSNVEYHYYVHNYSSRNKEESDTLAKSGAKVVVYHGSTQIDEFSIDGCEGATGIYWNVFTMKNGHINAINKVGKSKGVTENDYATATEELDPLAVEPVAETEAVTEEETTEEVSEGETTEEMTTEESSEEQTEEESQTGEEATEEESTEEEQSAEEESSEEAEEENADAQDTEEEESSAE